MKTLIKNIFIFLLAFLSVGAMVVGGGLIISPHGQLIKISLSSLENTPFTSFLIPGIILFIVLGLIPFVLAIVLTSHKNQYRIKRKNSI